MKSTLHLFQLFTLFALASPKLFAEDAQQEIVLLPKDATCSGAVMYVPGHECIEYWKGLGSSVSWKITHVPPGRYAVSIEYSANPGESGGTFEIVVGDVRKEESIKPTGGWGTFETKRLRVIEISSDNESLTLVAKEMPANGALMNLRKVTLKRKES